MKFEALILDCDGVIVDSEKFSCGAWNILMDELYNIDIGTNYNPVLGKNSLDAAKYYLSKYNIPFDHKKLEIMAKLKEETYYKSVKGKLQPVKGIKKKISEARKLGFKIAVASSGSLEKINFSLKQVGLQDQFDEITSADDVENGKPAPDLFLKSMKLLNVTPEKSIIIEDSLTGIEAAKLSGGFTIAITNTFSKEKLLKADLVIEKFEELNLKNFIFDTKTH